MHPIPRTSAALLLLCVASTAVASVRPSPTMLLFGPVPANTVSDPLPVTLINEGDTPSTINTLLEPDLGAFRHVGGTCGAAPFTLPPQGECTLVYTYSPSALNSQSATVRYFGQHSGSFMLDGSGVPPSVGDLETVGLWFDAAVGTTSAEKESPLSNVGNAPLVILSIAPPSGPFARTGGTCGTPPFPLDPGESCTVAYTFTPVEAGDVSEMLEVVADVDDEHVWLFGHGSPGSQTIAFPAQSARSYAPGGSAPIAPQAVASSGLAVVYGSATPAVCTVANAMATTVAAGTCTLTADQPGNASWLAAAQQTQSFVIDRAIQQLVFPLQTDGSRAFESGASFAIDPLATSAAPNSGQPIVYSSLDATVCTVSGTSVTMVGRGACHIAADQAGDANHHAATQRSVTVQLADPTDADLWVQKTADTAQARVGDTVEYTIRVGNAGPASASADVLDLPPDSLGNVVWSCVEAIGAVCPDPAADEGGIDVTLDLPDGASVRFQLLGTVLPGSGAMIENTASVSPSTEASSTDPDMENNESSASVAVFSEAVHADGFESDRRPRAGVAGVATRPQNLNIDDGYHR